MTDCSLNRFTNVFPLSVCVQPALRVVTIRAWEQSTKCSSPILMYIWLTSIKLRISRHVVTHTSAFWYTSFQTHAQGLKLTHLTSTWFPHTYCDILLIKEACETIMHTYCMKTSTVESLFEKAGTMIKASYIKYLGTAVSGLWFLF